MGLPQSPTNWGFCFQHMVLHSYIFVSVFGGIYLFCFV